MVEANLPLQGGTRVGYPVSGLLHLLIAWIALQVARGIASYGSSSPRSGSQK